MNDVDVKQVIVVRKDLNMRKGKIASQVAHASMKFLIENSESDRGNEVMTILSPDETEWVFGSMTKIVVGVNSEDMLRQLILIAKMRDVEVHEVIDEGRTQFNGIPTLTCAAFGPCRAEELKGITDGLELL